MSRIDLYPSVNSSPTDALTQTGTKEGQKVGADTFLVGGKVITGTATVPPDYDSGEVQYPNSLTEVYIYRKAGSVVKQVTITYTTTAKDRIATWAIA